MKSSTQDLNASSRTTTHARTQYLLVLSFSLSILFSPVEVLPVAVPGRAAPLDCLQPGAGLAPALGLPYDCAAAEGLADAAGHTAGAPRAPLRHLAVAGRPWKKLRRSLT